jgi:opacity protein-like surface antigen
MSLGTNPRIWFVLSLIAMSSLFATLALAQDPPAENAEESGPAGTWVTKIPGPQGEIEMKLVIEGDGDQWTARLTGARRTVEVEGFTVVENIIRGRIPNPELNMEVQLDGQIDGNKINATMKAGSFPEQNMLFIRQVTSVISEDGIKKYTVGSGPAGVWIGTVRAADGEESQVVLTLDKQGTDWLVTLEDPFNDVVQGQDVQVTDTMIGFTYRPQEAPFPSHFTGTYVAAEDRVSGSFSQRGTSRFVKFRRDPATVTLGFDAEGKEILPPRVRHAYSLAVTGRLGYWAALHMVKDEVYNVNDITTGTLAFDGALKYFVLDGFNVFVRGFRGGLGMSSDEGDLAPFDEINLTSDSYIKLDGFEFGVMGYLGNLFSEESDFNPYLTAAVGKASWELTGNGRGGDLLSFDDEPFEGSDFCFGFGLGTEYELKSNLCLEFEFLWRYFMTEDTNIWPDNEILWTNTHTWALSAGVSYGFF